MSKYKLILFVAIALTLTSCVWLRLLQTKIQLSNFDKNFACEVITAEDNTKSYNLLFKKPLLSTKDILFITFGPNTRTALPGTADTESWAYLFEKDGSPTTAPLHVYLHFTQKKLTKVMFPPTFATLLSSQQFRTICIALGNASLLKRKRIVNATVPLATTSEILTLTHLQKVMGRAHQQGHEKEGDYYLYRYHLRGKKQHVWVKLYFNTHGQCVKMQTHLAGGLINILFILPKH